MSPCLLLERDLETRLVTLVKAKGGLAFKLDPRANKGVPDRVIALPGRAPFFLELKTETGEVSPLQQHNHNKLRAIGHDVVVAFGLEELKNAIEK